MITLARIELRKLTTTPALYVSAGIVALFTVLSVAAGIMLAGAAGHARARVGAQCHQDAVDRRPELDGHARAGHTGHCR